jgi:ribonuclease PH
MTGQGRFVEVQGNGEETTFSREQLDGVLALAENGLREIAGLQTAFLARELLKT